MVWFMVVASRDLEDGGSVIFFADARVAQLLTRMLIPWRRRRRLARDGGLMRIFRFASLL